MNGEDDKDGVWSLETLYLGAGGDPGKGICAGTALPLSLRPLRAYFIKFSGILLTGGMK